MVLRLFKGLLAATLLISLPLHASDLAKEKRWADQIVDALIDGDAVYLSDGNNEFLGIYTEADADTIRGGAIVMHGSGVHPDWPTVVQPLRVGLTEEGWHTLSIQMPILDNDASYGAYADVFPESPARINAAIDYLKEQGVERIVLIAHSLGTGMTAYSLANASHDVAGFVAVGMGEGGRHPNLNNLAHLKKMQLPVLDLYGEEDLEGIVNSANSRREAAGHIKNYTQQMSPGADHFFEGEEEALLEAVGSWINQLP